MGSYGYHAVGFDGTPVAVRKAKGELSEALGSGLFGPLDDRPDPADETVRYSAPGLRHVLDETLGILRRIALMDGLREIRHHSSDADGEMSEAWLWTAAAGWRRLERAGVYTLTFGTALAVDTVARTGNGVAELADILLTGSRGRMCVEELAEAVGLARMVSRHRRDSLSRETLGSLAAWIRETVAVNEDDLIHGWLAADGQRMLADAEIYEREGRGTAWGNRRRAGPRKAIP